MKNTFLTFLTLLCFSFVFSSCSASKKATAVKTDAIDWVTMEELQKRSKKKPKKVMVDIYTDWCGWCKKMDKSTFIHPQIIKYVNENFYALKLDGEHKETLNFQDKDFKYIASGSKGYHELAYAFLNGRMSYPSIVFLDEELSLIQAIPGYKDPKTLDMILNYLKNDFHQNTPWQSFSESYNSPIQ